MTFNLYRPLLKLSKHSQNVYLPLELKYTLSEISAIKKYLPKLYTFSGVDAYSFQDHDKSVFDREKLKLKAINGKSIVDDQPLKFYKAQDLQTVQWKDTYLCLDVPFNLKQDQQSAKQELELALQNYLKTKMVMRSRINNQIYDSNSKTVSSISQIDLYLVPSQIEPQGFHKQYREIRVKLPLAIVVAKKENYDLNLLRQVLTDDILHSLRIMIKNEMSIRVIRGGPTLLLQSFVKQESYQEKEGDNLAALVNKKLQPTEQKQGKIEADQSIEGNYQATGRQDPSNRVLLLVLIGLAVIYIYLKLNPLQKSLNEL